MYVFEISNFSGVFLNTIVPGAAMVGKTNAALAPDCLFFSFSFFQRVHIKLMLSSSIL